MSFSMGYEWYMNCMSKSMNFPSSLILGLLAITLPAVFGQRLSAESKAKLSPDLAAAISAGVEEELDLIVQFKESATKRTASSRSWNAKSVRLRQDLSMIRGAAIRIQASELQSLVENLDVEYISPDREIAARLDKGRNATQVDVQWNTLGYGGTGTRVAVIDSGINHNEAFESGNTPRIVFEKSFIPGLTSTADGFGHGTHVASIVAGDGEGADVYEARYRGIAPFAEIVNLRVLDDNGAGKDSYVIAALQWIVTNKQDKKANLHIRVVNLSLGRPVFESYKTDPLCKAVEAVWNAGIVVVVAAGNEGRDNSHNTGGYGTINSPGNDPFVITVGAANTFGTMTRNDDMPTSYSSKGPSSIDHIVKPDLLAPGNKIVALGSGKLKLDNPANVVDPANSYMQLSGTSMATPFVSGAAILLIEKNAGYTPDQVKYLLMKNAWRGFAASSTITDPSSGSKFTVYKDIFTVGAGYMDIQAAINDKKMVYSSAQSPTAFYNGTTKEVTLVGGANVVWGDSTTPFNVVWGANVIAGTNVVWGDSVVWGNANLKANSVVWGDKSVYSSKSDGVDSEANKMLLKGE